MKLSQFKYALTAFFLPNFCLCCQQKTAGAMSICEQCITDLPWLSSQNLQINHAVSIDRLSIPLYYQPPISNFIAQLKFNHKLHYAKTLGLLLRCYLQNSLQPSDRPNLIIPVPLHSKRLRQRGFNQAIEISKWLTACWNIPIDRYSCQRVINTQPQSSLPAKKRQQNVKNAFQIIRPISAKHIAIVDDVFTTGHTLLELSKALKKAGVKKVQAWCCAKTNHISS